MCCCNNNQRRLYIWNNAGCDEHNMLHKDCPCLQPFRFHCIPKDEDMRMAWIKSINRKDFKPPSITLVCSLHFIDGRPTKQNPVPVVNMGYMPLTPRTPARQTTNTKTIGAIIKKNILDAALVNDIDHQTPEKEVFAADVEDDQTTQETLTAEKCTFVYVCCHSHPELCQKQFVDTSTQTQDLVVLDHAYSYMKSTRSTGTQHTTAEFSVGTISNDSDARFYTGLTLSVLLSLVSALTPFGNKFPFKLNVGDQIRAVLIGLRLGLSFKDIARRFGVSTQLASAMFKSWMTIIANNLNDCVCWLPRETIRRTLPGSFTETYPRTTCIIDCSEMFFQRPFTLKARAQAWSTYKSHNTAKFLVAIAPNGFIMYVSPLYGGRASDNFITKSSGFY